ncbi:hypothetical protein [Streptomyces sp. NPDC005385]|uniref:hypothetical protein n=1 Tax=Streptomyces sp. NPDC005385 TaxID=3157039 RepID=UPI0033B3055A
MMSNDSVVFFAHVREATDNCEDAELVTAIFKYLGMTGTFTTINGHRVWLQNSGFSDVPALVPCDTALDLDYFRWYLVDTREVPTTAAGAFLQLLKNVRLVLDAVYAEKGWKGVQAVSWPNFLEAYLERSPLYLTPEGEMYEPRWQD